MEASTCKEILAFTFPVLWLPTAESLFGSTDHRVVLKSHTRKHARANTHWKPHTHRKREHKQTSTHKKAISDSSRCQQWGHLHVTILSETKRFGLIANIMGGHGWAVTWAFTSDTRAGSYTVNVLVSSRSAHKQKRGEGVTTWRTT